MPAPPPLPRAVLDGPFTSAHAASLGLSEKVLRGQRFRRLHPRVWVHVDRALTQEDRIRAAELALPSRAQVSHVTRIQRLGLDILDAEPLHFTIAGELHLALEGIRLHRTKVLPPLDDVGVTPAAAFVQMCADVRLIDAVIVGDWLLHRRHMSVAEVADLARRDHWRPGAHQVLAVLPHLDAGAESPKESETRAVLVFAGLPRPEVNANVVNPHGVLLGRGDLVFRLWKLLVEYEGRHHLTLVDQWNRDIDRYGGFRDDGWDYIQVTNEKLGRPKKLVSEVYGHLVRRGFDGPAPVFGPRWASLFSVIPAQMAVSRRPR